MNRLIDIKPVINHIGKEITLNCSNKGYNVSVDCAARIAELTIHNPDYDFSDVMLRTKIQQLINVSVDKLTDTLLPSYSTIELQSFFISNFCPRENLTLNHRRLILQHTQPLLNDIIVTQTNESKEISELYKKLVTALTLLSGLGNPNIPIVLKEATGALHSVFPTSELPRFMVLSKEEKYQQILELKHIMSGIRLFNKDSKKGGEGIEDLPSIVEQSVVATKQVIETAIQEVESKINAIIIQINNCYKVETNPQNKDLLTVNLYLQEFITNDDLDKLKCDTILLTQLNIYYKTILNEIEECEKDVHSLSSKFSLRLNQLHDTVRYRTAIPTGQVYPQFMELSIIWSSFQDQMMVLSTMHNLFYAIQKIAVHEPLNEEKLNILTMVQSQEPFDSSEKIQPSKVKCEVVEFVNISEYNPKLIQYYGNCAFNFVEMSGAIIPGEPSIGLLRYNGILFAFSSVQSAQTFGQSPEKYFQLGLDIICRKPEIIIMFNMDGQIKNMKQMRRKSEGDIMYRCNAEVQTETHPIEANIDPTYSWNIWDYKKKALQLANICNSVTHSVQTIKSHKRESIGIQAAPMKDGSAQTRRDSSSNVPKLSNYIFGLRGRSDDKQHVITLTRPVDEFLRKNNDKKKCPKRK